MQSTSGRPFSPHPNVGRYFPSSPSEEARERLSRAIERGDGPALLIGAAGTGKSLLLEVLAEQFRDQYAVARLACAQLCTRRALLQAILFELGLPFRCRDEGELRLTLIDHLLPNERCENGMLLLVDEAQSLPIRLLEEIRLLTNLVRDGQPRVRLVLAGTPGLEECFASPELESFSQRVATRCFLAPFSEQDTFQYIRAQLAAAGGDADELITSDAMSAIFLATDGVPRLVNQVADRAFDLADRQSVATVDRRIVQEAWADLQQLPTPWETSPAALNMAATASVVEFGALDGPDEDDPDTMLDDDLDEVAYLDEPYQVESPTNEDQPSPASAVDLSAATPTLKCEDEEAYEDSEGDDEISDAGVSIAVGPLGVIGSSSDDEGDAAESDDTESDDSEEDEPVEPLHISMAPPPLAGRHGGWDATEQFDNPFDETFVEETVVLEQFGAMQDVLPRGTQRVQNQQDTAFATLVQSALEESERQSSDRDDADLPDDAGADEHEDDPSQGDSLLPAARIVDFAAYPVVNTLPGLDDEVQAADDEQDFETAEEIAAEDYAASLSTVRYPQPSVALHDSESQSESADTAEDADELDERLEQHDSEKEEEVLIVEQETVEQRTTDAGVRRQDYRQLFAQLRRG